MNHTQVRYAGVRDLHADKIKFANFNIIDI